MFQGQLTLYMKEENVWKGIIVIEARLILVYCRRTQVFQTPEQGSEQDGREKLLALRKTGTSNETTVQTSRPRLHKYTGSLVSLVLLNQSNTRTRCPSPSTPSLRQCLNLLSTTSLTLI